MDLEACFIIFHHITEPTEILDDFLLSHVPDHRIASTADDSGYDIDNIKRVCLTALEKLVCEGLPVLQML